HRFFRPVVLVFSFFTLLQLGSGALLYGMKIGFHPAQTIEFYKGSEAAVALYPSHPDRFVSARTFTGMAKGAVGHCAAYGLLCFAIMHLLRSLTARTLWMARADALG